MEGGDVIDGSDGVNAGRLIIDFLKIRTIYPEFQVTCAWLSGGCHMAFIVLLSDPETPFTSLAHHPFLLVSILFCLWPGLFLYLKFARLLEEHIWIATSATGGFVRFLIDAIITVGLAIASAHLSYELVGLRHLAGVLCLLADITFLELWMLEDMDFCLGDSVFNLASGIALLKFNDRSYAVGVIALFCARRASLFILKQMLLARKNAEKETSREREVTSAAAEREELIRVAAEREELIREEAVRVAAEREELIREEAARSRMEVYQMEEKHAADVAALQEMHAAAMKQAKIEQEAAVAAARQQAIAYATERTSRNMSTLHRLFSEAKLGFEEPEDNEAFMDLGWFIGRLNDAPSSSNPETL